MWNYEILLSVTPLTDKVKYLCSSTGSIKTSAKRLLKVNTLLQQRKSGLTLTDVNDRQLFKQYCAVEAKLLRQTNEVKEVNISVCMYFWFAGDWSWMVATLSRVSFIRQ